MNTCDDATWLPEGALIILGACQRPDCVAVGWARGTYVDVDLTGDPDAPPAFHYVMHNVLDRVETWCPLHGTTDNGGGLAGQYMEQGYGWQVPDLLHRRLQDAKPPQVTSTARGTSMRSYMRLGYTER